MSEPWDARQQAQAAQPGYAGMRSRVAVVDAVRGVALLAMAHFHFIFDLEMFGYLERGTAGSFPWKPYARTIAATFLFLVGLSLVLAHSWRPNPLGALRDRRYWRRIAQVAGAAAIITVATYFTIPTAFIFFGILHHIALASLLGLLFVRLPWPALSVLAMAAFALPRFVALDQLNGMAGWWTGLASTTPLSNDFVPLFPWFAAVLVGMAFGRLALQTGWAAKAADWEMTSAPARALRWLGRRSLAVYLLHQPVIIGLMFVYAKATGHI
ncbi:MAG: heparan-alpha-glucosaminide N-acetyltransferase [Pseudomonadota bacterium]